MKLRNLALVFVLAAPVTMQFAGAQDAKKTQKPEQTPKEALDPVCGLTIVTANAPKSDFKGKTYYFCSLDDKKEFDRAPASYIKVEKKETTAKK